MTDGVSADLSEEIQKDHFRVSIFGSAQTSKGDELYCDVYELAKQIGNLGFDIVTGGGPGLMEAANAGHQAGARDNEARSIGLTIKLPFEAVPNKHLDIKQDFDRFSNRLDTFMVLSQVCIVTPGGVGTCLEFFYSWQLTQVNHICNIPIILYGDLWPGLVKWLEEFPLKRGLIGSHDMDSLLMADNDDVVLRKITQLHEIYLREGDNFCLNFKKYKID